MTKDLKSALQKLCEFDESAAKRQAEELFKSNGVNDIYWAVIQRAGLIEGARYQHAQLKPLLDCLLLAVEALKKSQCGCLLHKEGEGRPPVKSFFAQTEISICKRCEALTAIQEMVGK